MSVIRLAQDQDATFLPDLEQSAGEAFRTIPALAWIADEDNLSVERYRELIAQGTSWVAVDAQDQPIGFLSAEILTDALHIWELAVRLDQQRSGHGRALIGKAIEVAQARGLAAVTLTTFRGVAWNEILYQRLGFQTLTPMEAGERLHGILLGEAERGLPPDQRCAMRLALSAG
jgi:ribosomal protein S18 acetylase RimI-like enzyme